MFQQFLHFSSSISVFTSLQYFFPFLQYLVFSLFFNDFLLPFIISFTSIQNIFCNSLQCFMYFFMVSFSLWYFHFFSVFFNYPFENPSEFSSGKINKEGNTEIICLLWKRLMQIRNSIAEFIDSFQVSYKNIFFCFSKFYLHVLPDAF